MLAKMTRYALLESEDILIKRERVFISESLFLIPDAASAKDVQFTAALNDAEFRCGFSRVISKPSKKRQTVRYNELSFESGGCVALFNRVRSQTLGYISASTDGFENGFNS
ncbi:Oidioi.mRNA.OKI2018_I69.chr2.g5328.t1.cds [Oikopleura dioica]|uniref:Oidioi.mRNA.OKI2018_I69.chr2.g5328.t1.cds n=1 Tax=Oikopleura dioica TaxID=34765 RepID=A0ABN7T0J1_OIKDI|nr:Oidioi.mRNA.OKI2018_I69.chr2.g5328.t1.cds [Oikopleura dioica]